MARPRRITGYSYTGRRRYFLTTCTWQRTEYFRDAAKIALVLDQLFAVAHNEKIVVVAYCVMPDHVHLLVDGMTDDASLTRFARLWKQRAGYYFTQQYRQALWQKGYHDRVLRDEETTEAVAFYVITNPIRKGLVQNALDYPFWGSQIYTREELIASVDSHAERRT